MYDEESIRLSFSVAEKQQFLERRGYTVEREVITKEVNIYQNVFVPKTSIDTFASKGEYKEQIHIAFLYELRAQLLKL